VMDKYAPGANTGSIAEGGYISVLGLARGAKGLQGDPAPASVLAAMSAMAPAQLPLAPDGAQFQCGKKVVAITPAVCSSGGLLTTLDKNGKGGEYTNIDSSQITKLG